MAHTKDELETLRADILGRHVARLAARYAGVRAARKLLLGNEAGTVSESEAARLLRSPATALLGPRHFAPHGIPWNNHRASVESRKAGHSQEAAWKDYRVRVSWPDGERVLSERITLGDVLGHGPRLASLPEPRWDSERVEGRLRRRLVWRLEGHVPVHPGTWLQRLADAAADTATTLDWSGGQAALFILTGRAPTQEPIAVTFEGGRGEEVLGIEDSKVPPTVVLRVQPFVRRDALARAYRRAQIEACDPRAFRLRPGAVLQERALQLFDFVEVKRQPGVSFEMLRQWWNRRVPVAWQYATYRLLRSHYLQTRVRLLGPS